jgi:flavin reductase (DIM6/NTAB) family NADH-FMN oxidoreductase RutF
MHDLNTLAVPHLIDEQHRQAQARRLARRTDETPPTGTFLRELLREVAQPVVVVTGCSPEGGLVAMTVSSFTSVSLAPPRVLFCPQSGSRTWAAIAPRGRFVVNVLAAGDAHVAARFARPERQGGPTRHERDAFGVPVLPEAVSWASCRTTQVHTVGDHLVVVAAVDRTTVGRGSAPLAYWRGRYATVTEEEPCPC